jgi:flagellin FlaB
MNGLVFPSRRARDERGITGLETAIVLIAFVVVAAVFAFVVLSTGLFSSERGKETIFAGLAKTRGSMELTGSIMATSNQTKVTAITFDLTLTAGGASVSLDSAATANKTIISFHDGQHDVNSVSYTATAITGNSDLVLEAGELMEITLDLTTGNMATVAVGANAVFTIEIKPPQGSYMVIQRTTPPSIAHTLINLN